MCLLDNLMSQTKSSSGDERISLLQEAEKVLVQDDAAIA